MIAIYCAGPMRGVPELNFPLFAKATARLREQGHTVFSPAEEDVKRHNGVDISKGNTTGSETQATEQHGFSLRAALAADCKFICLQAEAIALLPGWEKSKGATAERALADCLGLQVIYLNHDAEII